MAGSAALFVLSGIDPRYAAAFAVTGSGRFATIMAIKEITARMPAV